MNDHWRNEDGSRWYPAAKARVARLFRHHVRTPTNPTGRIHREPCWFCAQRSLKGSGPALEHLPPGSAHHLDYDRPFVVLWVCESDHRKVDHGSLRVPARAVCDYSSLVSSPGIARPGGRREAKPHLQLARTGTDDLPF